MNINLTLFIFALILVITILHGFRKGMTKEIAGLVAWIVTLFVMSMILMIYSRFRAEETGSAVASIILLLIVGLIYGVVRIFFKSVHAISKLPIFHFLDQMLGGVIGFGEGILIIWLLYILNAGGLLGSFGEILMRDTMENGLLTMLYEYNYLVRLVAGIL